MTSSDSIPSMVHAIPGSTAWAVVVLVFVLVVVAPAVWSKRAARAVTVLRLIADTVVDAVTAWRSPRR